MAIENHATLRESHNPLDLVHRLGGRPEMNFAWKQIAGKRRLIGRPNKTLRVLHELFGQYLARAIISIRGNDGYALRKLPSATAFVKGTNPLRNALAHREGRFFYVSDIRDAYPNVDLERLAALIVYIRRHDEYGDEFPLAALGSSIAVVNRLKEDSLYPSVLAFLESFCSGVRGEGLAVGAPMSPYLFNLYCEAYLDGPLRGLCQAGDVNCTRYADDLTFSRSRLVFEDLRRDIRSLIRRAKFDVNHRKSKVLSREMGTVFVTKIGLHDAGAGSPARLVFLRRKRRKLHGIIGSYLHFQMDWPEKVSGYIAEFLHYYKNVGTPTATDKKTFALCKAFEVEWAKTRHR